MLELDGDFFGRKKKCVGAGISGRGPPWAHEAGGAPRVGGRALDPRGQVPAPPAVFSMPNILQKFLFHFRTFGELLFSGYFYCKDNSKNRQKILILLYLLQIFAT